MPKKPEDLTGRIFGQLRILPSYRYVSSGKNPDGKDKRRIQWLCECAIDLGGCGIQKFIYRDSLLNTRTLVKCCGICSAVTHGRSGSPEYVAWVNMHQRCYNPKNISYENYGGRGIQVEERWHTFENFFADMGVKPGADFSLDKLDNYQNYGPGNCKWATDFEQNQNRRSN